ncbi:MAG: hypothetical protein KC609_15635 [Myxococcales bacterium]|nr:hypothetical protein [Myxococcales bacterium]
MTDDLRSGHRREASLSELIDWAAGEDGRRDELFLRTFAQFLDQQRERIRIEAIEGLALLDVVVTFKMKGSVTLIATGYTADHPGELTWRVDEVDFPTVRVSIGDDLAGQPYDFCTLDYSWQGRTGVLVRPVALGETTLAVGTIVGVIVVSTLGQDEHVRVRIGESGELANLSRDSFKLI